MLLFLLFLFFLPNHSVSTSLNELICRRQPRYCPDQGSLKNDDKRPLTSRQRPLISDYPKSPAPTVQKTFLAESDLDQIPRRPVDFSSWEGYGKVADDGTGYGSGIGPGYGPGLGDIAVRTGVGVQYPFGNIGVRRDFELGFGGSGRISGQPFGFGNGYSANGLGIGQSGWPHPPPFSNGDYWPLG